MGFNTTVLILNDGLHYIEKDLANWWSSISRLASGLGVRDKPVDVGAGGFANASSVLAVEHADTKCVIATGGNHGTVLAKIHGLDYSHHDREHIIKLLGAVADDYGYRLIKKPPGTVK